MTRHDKYYSGQSLMRINGRTAVARASQNQTSDQGTFTLPHAIPLVVLALAHLFDYTSFLVMMERHGLAAEANPVVVVLAQLIGLPGLTIAKVVTVAFAATLVVLIAPRRRRLAMGLLIFGISAGLVGGISNVATL